MPPRISISRPLRSLAHRARAEGVASPFLRSTVSIPRRTITANEKPLPVQDKKGQPGPNQEQLPHVSEEAAAQNRITGDGSAPEIEQGTPVQEILARDETATKNAPEVMKDSEGKIDTSSKVESEYAETSSSTAPGTGKGGNVPPGARSYSTSARRMQDLQTSQAGSSQQLTPDMMAMMSAGDGSGVAASTLPPGLKFELPAVPLGRSDNKDYRYDPCIMQLVGTLMRGGQKSKAISHMARILDHLRTSPPPSISPARPMLPGAPPPAHLPLNPRLYIQLAIDSVAPLFKLNSVKGIAGGGASVHVPAPLALKQRRRQAFKWILEAVEKKPSRGSGKDQFAQKVADEIIAVVEGRSGVWEKRQLIHKQGTAARSNIGKKPRKQKGVGK